MKKRIVICMVLFFVIILLFQFVDAIDPPFCNGPFVGDLKPGMYAFQFCKQGSGNPYYGYFKCLKPEGCGNTPYGKYGRCGSQGANECVPCGDGQVNAPYEECDGGGICENGASCNTLQSSQTCAGPKCLSCTDGSVCKPKATIGCSESCKCLPIAKDIDVALYEEGAQTHEDERGGYNPVKFGGKITPFEDIICEATIKRPLPSTCSKEPVVKGEIVTFDANGNEKLVAVKFMEKYGANADESELYYGMLVNGWKDGWTTDDEAMEVLVANIAKNPKSVKCRVTPISSDGSPGISNEKIFEASACVHLWGDPNWVTPKKRIVSYNNYYSSINLVKRAINDYQTGYLQIDPFAYYKHLLIFQADLTKHYGKFEENKHACAPGRINNFYDSATEESHAKIDGNVASLHVELTDIILVEGATATVHESGHLLGLEDEYLYTENLPTYNRNCQFNIPFYFNPYGRPYKGCTYLTSYRTTATSIMKAGRSVKKFNDWSCAFLKKSLTGYGDLIANAKFCRDNMNTIHEWPDGPISCNPSSITPQCGNEFCNNCEDDYYCKTKNENGECAQDGGFGICNTGNCVINLNWECLANGDCLENEICSNHQCIPIS